MILRPTPSVTDHAVLRYLERAYDIPVEQARAEIARICQRGVEAGANYVTHGRLRYVLRGAAVVTVMPSEWRVFLDEPRPACAMRDRP
jgi:hypothetical protein